jgi:hypothetical protein
MTHQTNFIVKSYHELFVLGGYNMSESYQQGQTSDNSPTGHPPPPLALAMAFSKSFVLHILTLMLSICLPLSESIHFNIPAVFNFGDSNSDTGELIAAGIESINHPYGQSYFHRPSGRYCDGRLIIDFLSNLFILSAIPLNSVFFLYIPPFPLFSRILDLSLLFIFFMQNVAVDAMDKPFLNAYLDSIGLPNFRRGCNFASAGSTILPASPTSVSPFSFGLQVAQFLRFKARALELLAQSMYTDHLI